MNPILELPKSPCPSRLETSVFLPIEEYAFGFYLGERIKFCPDARNLTPPLVVPSKDYLRTVDGDFMFIYYYLVLGLDGAP